MVYSKYNVVRLVLQVRYNGSSVNGHSHKQRALLMAAFTIPCLSVHTNSVFTYYGKETSW